MTKRLRTTMVAVTVALLAPSTDTSAQVPVSNRCFTPYFWCFIPHVVPVGTPCYCASPYGPVQGIVR